MTPERWQRIDQLLEALLDLDPSRRAQFLDQACDGDETLRREVESLIEVREQAQDFIEAPPTLEEVEELFSTQPQVPLAGQMVAHYRLLSLLGAGGMGTVYLAEDTRLHRRVALKLLLGPLTADPQRRARFLREARLAAALDHPNICTIHEVGEDAGRLFIAMQYVEGKTLKELIAGEPLSAEQTLQLGLQIADALEAAHARGIIHRDIKPGNIMVTPRGRGVVLDFGLAKLMEAEVASGAGEQLADLTHPGVLMGTPAYMSPEQARGEPVDHRSDIFSFGAVLYEMATGRTPFAARSQAETMSAVINQPHAPVTELNQEIPHSLAAIIDRALAKTAAERYQSVEEMSGDLRRATETTLPFSPDCCEGAVLPPVAEQTRARPSPFVSRPIGLLAASAALILLVIAAYALWPKPDTAPPINSIAVLPFKPLATESRDEALELGMAEALITRLTGIKQLTVLPVSAVRKYGALDQDAVAAGRQLKVDAVLDGSIQRVGGRTRVTVQLWRVADGRQLWRDAFDDQRESIFALQDSISARTAAALVSRLTGEERQRLAKHYTENTEAYHLYVKGRYIWSKRRREEYGQAIEYFQQAITKDPTYALAWVGLADCYALGGGGRSSRETYPKAKEAATRALELDATLAEAHAAMGKVQMFYDWSLVAAEAEFKHAIELDPNYATAYQYYADCLAAMGRTDEALAQIKLARALDPLSELLIRDTGRVLYYARRYDEAATQCRTALEMNARFQPAIDSLGDIYLQQRRHGEAIAQYQQALKLAPGMALMKAQLAHAYAAAGRSDEAHQILAELLAQAKERPVPAFDLAIIYLGLGNRDEALRQLEQAYEERFYRLIYLGADPLFDPLRSDARFNDLLRRIGLQP